MEGLFFGILRYVECIFTILLPVNFAKPNLVLLFVGIADLFVAKMSSSETVAKREAILIAVPKQ